MDCDNTVVTIPLKVLHGLKHITQSPIFGKALFLSFETLFFVTSKRHNSPALIFILNNLLFQSTSEQFTSTRPKGFEIRLCKSGQGPILTKKYSQAFCTNKFRWEGTGTMWGLKSNSVFGSLVRLQGTFGTWIWINY